jgi:hypothetical protein
MGVRLSVGLQKKVGLPDFGSLGASCHVEFEIDRGLLEHDLDGFHQKVADAFVACRQAVQDQLATAGRSHGEAIIHELESRTGRNGHSDPNRTNAHVGSNGNSHRPEIATVTQSQLRAIHAISRRIRIDLPVLLRERFQLERAEDLSIRQASSLIDELKRGIPEVRT